VSEPKNAVRHVAITPWVPNSQASIQNTTWTVIPVRAHEVQDSSAKSAHSSVRLPVSSLSLQSFYKTLQLVSPGKALLRRDTPIEIRIVNVVPVALEAVYVTLDVDGLLKLHDSHVKFGGGFTNGSKTEPLRHKALNGVTGQQKPKTPIDERALEATWRQAVKTALSSTSIVHAGDQIALPLPAHPITHNAAPPAKVTTCEPVSQGFISSTTRIIIIRQSEKQKGPKQLKLQVTNGIPEEDEDTSNEQFYSAAEERPGSMRSTDIDDHSTTDFSDAQSIVTDGEDLTDDEALISLSAPLLPPQTSGILSSYNAATPRPGGFYTNNIGTPGSLQSASTVRAGAGSGKTFKAQGLLQRIPDDLLHPKPPADDDEEARIYVETAALVKIGCFSGDWVRIEAAQEPNQGGLGLVPWHTSFSDEPLAQADWRPVKIFGLPESKKPIRFSSHKSGARRAPSFHYERSAPLPNAYLPPVLLANLASPTHLKITPLVAPGQGLGRLTTGNSKDRITSSSMPPLANEVKILKILSPLSHDIQLQPALYAELKDYFEGKRRIMKTGDLVAISFDETLGRSMYQTGNDAAQDDLLSRSKRSRVAKAAPAHDKSRSSVAWFKVTSIVPEGSKDDEVDDLWGGVGFVDVSSSSSSTKLIQNGNESSRLPPALNSSWQYYQGARGLPGTTGNRLPGTMGLPEPYVSPMRRRLRGLISASTSPQAVHMGLPPLAILLTSTQRQIGKAHTAQRACEDLGLHCCIIDAYDATTNTTAGASETEEYFKARAQRALSCGPQNTVLLLKHMDALTGDRMLPVFKDILAESRVIVATTTDPEKIPEAIRSLFTNELELGAPDEGEREGILRDIVEGLGLKLSPGVELTSIALKTAALVAGDLLDVVSRAVVAKHTRLEKITSGNSGTTSDSVVTVQDLEVAGGSSTLSLTKADFESAVDAARKNFADAIGAPKIPNVGWDDVGGLAHIKEAVMETIQLPLARPELFAKGMKKRSGILFYGPPGTGKTLLAKAIATEFSLNFFSVKGPELLNMYIGESEANVRRVFQRARDARPCVVFFDELDSVAPKRGNQGDSGGVMDRIVSQLLAELDGMSNGEEGGGGVFVIGATNRPDLLDQALLRPGRFDKMLYLGISDTHEKQQKIMEALSRKYVYSLMSWQAHLLTYTDLPSTPVVLCKRFRKVYHSPILVPIFTLCAQMPCSRPLHVLPNWLTRKWPPGTRYFDLARIL
jgi:peroxin-6